MKANDVRRILISVVLCLALTGCDKERGGGCVITETSPSSFTYHSNGIKGRIELVAVDTTWEVRHLTDDSLRDVWTLRDTVYQFDCGDLTGDGTPEIVVGVIKATRYRHELDKRLFIFHLYKGRLIRPLWLGSRMGLPLKDFKVERDSLPAMVHTWERDTDGTTVERIYRQQGFGLKFVSELLRKEVKVEVE